MPKDYLVATIKPWNLEAFARHRENLPGRWFLATTPEELKGLLSDGLKPRYIFFPHWSWKVPTAITEAHECVCFHMTDVPFGRGGSPLQNLIARGFTRTKLSALRMVEELDAGPVYAKTDLSLEGSAGEIFARAAEEVFTLIRRIVADEPQPQPQQGEVVAFFRRTPAQSRLPEATELRQVYDHIRMLDAEGYPAAFVDHGFFRIEFRGVRWDGEQLLAQVAIRRREEA